ncbi:uncharacterized protein LOC117643145 [Thrips palmi]|uniref:Uncharacterized protein LOC117643145 n=1 Tax=Thrips palmi TaxID=161013 RepID=A0A6P8YUJ9_THRPL|nr:uncharacterized protein LOC117643145 [Thrips palmi]
MTPIRALFFLAAITAACAARIPAQGDDTQSLKTQIALLSHQRLTGNPVENAIEKFKELVRKIKERVHQLENVIVDALQASSVAVAKKIDDLVFKRFGIQLNLEGRLEDLEKKSAVCNAAFKTDLKQVLDEIKADTETCAAKQIAEAKDIRAQVGALLQILETVPVETINDIKACDAAPTDAPATDAPATDAPATDAPATDAPAPATDAPAIPDNGVAVRGSHSLGSWSDAWRKAKCVTKVLAKGANELADVPDLVAKLVSDAADLYNKESRDKLQACAAQSLNGKGDRVQLAAAQLAYCIIAPSQKQ